MDREILYRGKRIDNGEWVEGYVVVYPSGKTEVHKKCTQPPDILLVCEIDPETVCQYTGLTDKNGKKIFEGDIIKNEYGYIGIVKWECCAFVLDWISWRASRDLYVWSSSVEVIGNIFDNPELTGGTE